MTSKSSLDPQDPFNQNQFDSAADPFGGGTPTATPALTGEAILAQSVYTGTATSVIVSSLGIGVANANGFNVNLEFDAAAASSSAFMTGIEQAALILAQTLTDKITVNLTIDESGTGGGASAGPSGGYYESYSTVQSDLVNGATKGDPTFEALPTGSTIAGQSQVAVWNAQLKLWGLLPANSTGVDGSATFATDIASNALVGVALHELAHAIGRVPYGSSQNSPPDIFDFYRFTSSGSQLISDAIPSQAASFSVDGGKTLLAAYGLNSDPSDFLNSGAATNKDAFDEYYTPGTTYQYLTTLDKEQLAALGFHLSSPLTTTVQTDTNTVGSTSLVELFSDYYLENPTTGLGPELTIGGSPVTAAILGSYTLVGAAPLAGGGYEVAFQIPGTEQFSIWDTNSSGAFVSYTLYSGNSPAFQAVEASFNQDFIPVTGTTIQTDTNSYGSVSLVEVGTDFYLNNPTTGAGPEVQIGGSPVTAGELSPYTPIGAALISGGGYEVAFKYAANDTFSIWTTNSSGAFVSYGLYSGNSPVLESLEKSIFNQDLNGDGTIGLPVGTTLIQTDTNSYGSTSLVEVGSSFYLENSSTGVGPELKFGGSAVAAAAFAPYVLIGAAPLSGGGYEVAWENAATNTFSIWNTDSSGNFVSYAVYSGNSPALASIEASFNQTFTGATVPASTNPATQPASVTVANSDTFLFATNDAAVNGANTSSATGAAFDATSLANEHQFAAFFQDSHAGASSFQGSNNGHDTFADPGHHDGTALADAHLANLHGNGFIIA